MAATTLDCDEFMVLILTNSAVSLSARSQAARQLNGSINPETWPSASYATRQDLGFTDRNGLRRPRGVLQSEFAGRHPQKPKTAHNSQAAFTIFGRWLPPAMADHGAPPRSRPRQTPQILLPPSRNLLRPSETVLRWPSDSDNPPHHPSGVGSAARKVGQ